MILRQRSGVSCGPEMKKGLPSLPNSNTEEMFLLLPFGGAGFQLLLALARIGGHQGILSRQNLQGLLPGIIVLADEIHRTRSHRNMRTLLTVALSGLIAAAGSSTAHARDKNDPAKNPEPRLKVGAAAPALKADKWLQGAEVKEFAPGKVYVVEFWATWCGPCIGMMPHLGQLQAAYRDKGLTVVGFTSKDPNNTAKKVREFVARRGPKLGYTFAYADDSATHEAWMGAAGQNGIPCSFVIDKTGHIAFIGHPMYLDDVLPAVIAGTWKAADGPALVEKLDAEMEALDKAADGNDAAAGLKAFAAFEARHPRMAQAHLPHDAQAVAADQGQEVPRGAQAG